MATDQIREAVVALITDPLSEAGYDVEAVEVTPAGKRRLLRIALDADGGINLDEVAEASQLIGELLDADDLLGEQPYTLEVTSRGVERPLTLPRHWRRNQRRLVKVVTAAGETLTGRIEASDEDTVQLDVNGRQRTLKLADVKTARIQVEFNRKDEVE